MLFARINNLHAFSPLPSSFLLCVFSVVNLGVWIYHSRCVPASFVLVTKINHIFDIISYFPFYYKIEVLQEILMLCVCVCVCVCVSVCVL